MKVEIYSNRDRLLATHIDPEVIPGIGSLYYLSSEDHTKICDSIELAFRKGGVKITADEEGKVRLQPGSEQWNRAIEDLIRREMDAYYRYVTRSEVDMKTGTIKLYLGQRPKINQDVKVVRRGGSGGGRSDDNFLDGAMVGAFIFGG